MTFEEKIELLANMHVESDRRAEERQAQYIRWREDHEKRQAEQTERLRREQEKTEATLRRAIRLAVREARNERKRRHSFTSEFDQKMTQLAAAQLLTEETLRQFIKSLERGGNGQRA